MAQRKKVLIVDDNRDAAETLSMVVEMGGHEVHLAHDGASALRIAVAHQPAVVFLDIGMPGMNGYEIGEQAAGTSRLGIPHAGGTHRLGQRGGPRPKLGGRLRRAPH